MHFILLLGKFCFIIGTYVIMVTWYTCRHLTTIPRQMHVLLPIKCLSLVTPKHKISPNLHVQKICLPNIILN